VNYVDYVNIWGDAYMIMFVFCDTCTFMMMVMKWEWCKNILVISFNDDYFGDGDEVWIICTWLGDSFDDDDFLVYTLEMMIVFIWDN